MPEVYLPADTDKMKEWAVVACDQYTSDTDYWEDVKKLTDNAPSTLNLIYPECYLNENNPEERIKSINDTMRSYLEKGILKKNEPSFYLVKDRMEKTAPTGWDL